MSTDCKKCKGCGKYYSGLFQCSICRCDYCMECVSKDSCQRKMIEPSELYKFEKPHKIKVVTMSGQVHQIPVNLDDQTTKYVKSKVEERWGIKPRQQRLVFEGNLIANGVVLRDCGLKSGDSVRLIIRMYD